MTVEVLKPGLSTTVQDLGRPGYYHLGIPPSGALDQFSLTAANMLVGNDGGRRRARDRLHGPGAGFTEATVVAVPARRSRRRSTATAPLWESFAVGAGATCSPSITSRRRAGLHRGRRRHRRAGVLGSRSTYTLGALGGFEGRPLQAGDELPVGAGGRAPRRRRVPEDLRPTSPRRRAARRPGPVRPPAHRRRAPHVLRRPTWKVTPDGRPHRLPLRAAKLEFVPREQPFGAGTDPSNIVDAPTRSARSRCRAASSRSCCIATPCPAAAT